MPDGAAPLLDAVARMNAVIDHRGPDGQGAAAFDANRQVPCDIELHGSRLSSDACRDATVVLGHRRLAIIDLSDAGLQPMANEDRSCWLTFNGEIYNFVELRSDLERSGHRFATHTDSEVILHAYEEWGQDCVHRFVGMWAFAILDFRKRLLFCARDRFGIKPLHYVVSGRTFAFASEIKQLLEMPFVSRAPDDVAVVDYLRYESVDAGAQTFFRDVRRLPQGHTLTLQLDGSPPVIEKYYPTTMPSVLRLSEREASEEFARLLTESVRVHLRSDVDVGSCLSGGLDSAAIVCLAARLRDGHASSRQHTFSARFDEPEANEEQYARDVIAQTAAQDHWVTPSPEQLQRDLDCLVWHQEEPFGSTSIFAQWSVMALARGAGVKVLLDGQGADEQLAGYVSLAPAYFAEMRAQRTWLRLLRETWRHARLQEVPWLPLLPGALGKRLHAIRGSGTSAPARPALDWLQPDVERATSSASYYISALQDRPYEGPSTLSNLLYQFTFRLNLPALLRYEDRNSMAFSIESRVPFLDHRLVEFSFALPSSFKIRNGWTKAVMRDGMRGVIPESIRLRRRKMGFATPEAKWQRTFLQPLVRAALSDDRVQRYVQPDRAQAFGTAVQERGLLDFAPWRWANLKLWMDRYAVA